MISDRTDAKRARAKQAFLIGFRATGNVSEACRQAHIHRSVPYDWRREDDEFAAAWDEAEEVAVDGLEEAARRRALDSSDNLLMFLLKAHRPDKFRERGVERLELTGKDGGPVVVETARERLREKLAAVAARLPPFLAGPDASEESA